MPPLYEYECPCGIVTEKLEKMSTEKIVCQCGKIARRRVSSGSFHLKGSGFYENDYKRRNQAHD